MSFLIPSNSEKFGFVIEGFGAHSGRTIMSKDMKLLLESCLPEAEKDEYAQAVLVNNVLLKKTGAARKEAYSRLSRLYGLDNSILLFRVFREFWEQDKESQSLILILYAIARDPILRVSVDLILNSVAGDQLVATDFEKEVVDTYGDQLTEKTTASIGRNIASSWTQSGHLTGRSNKIRTIVESNPTSVAFALFLGYLCGDRGDKLFHSKWAKLLDTPIYELQIKAQVASQQGWLEYRQTGSITEISFEHLLEGVDL